MIDEGDEHAKLIYDAMGYHVAKGDRCCGSCPEGQGESHNPNRRTCIQRIHDFPPDFLCGFHCACCVGSGRRRDEGAVRGGAKRVLDGEETPLNYEEEIIR